MGSLTRERFVRMTEAVCLGTDKDYVDMEKLAIAARKYNFLIVYGLNCFTPHLISMLEGSDTKVGAPVGGSLIGADLPEVKLYDAKQLIEMGCKEIDMIMNIPFLRSGMYDEILKEIKQMRVLAKNLCLKVIIESPMLTDDQIKIASKIVVASNADFIKTSTGTYGKTTLAQVRLIRQTIGDKVQIKAAGGVNSLEMIESLIDLGVSRFGLSYGKAVAIADSL